MTTVWRISLTLTRMEIRIAWRRIQMRLLKSNVSQMGKVWGICFDHFSLMSFILLLAEHFPYTPCNFTLDCQKMDEPCGGLMDVGCWCLFGQCVTGDEGGKKECSKTEDCTKMDKCASGHCYCEESNRAGNEPSRSLKFYNHKKSPY